MKAEDLIRCEHCKGAGRRRVYNSWTKEGAPATSGPTRIRKCEACDGRGYFFRKADSCAAVPVQARQDA